MMRKRTFVVNKKFSARTWVLVGRTAEIRVRGHRAFDSAGERRIFKKNDAAVSTGFIAETDLCFKALPGEDLHRPSCELPRRAIKGAVPRLKKCQQLIMGLFAMIPDRDAGEAVIDGCKLHRFDLGWSERRRGSLQLVRLQSSCI